jgi:hypothetical protein
MLARLRAATWNLGCDSVYVFVATLGLWSRQEIIA